MSKQAPKEYTETHLIECTRNNSQIDTGNDAAQNAVWTTQTDFQVRKGDRISVEMMALNVPSTDPQTTIEFTQDNVLQGREEQSFIDSKVLLEVFYYVNNHQVCSNNLPFRIGGQYDNTLEQNGKINGGDITIPGVGEFPQSKVPTLKVINKTNTATNSGLYMGIGMGFGCPYDDSALVNAMEVNEPNLRSDKSQFQTPTGADGTATSEYSLRNSYRVVGYTGLDKTRFLAPPVIQGEEIYSVVLERKDTTAQAGVTPPIGAPTSFCSYNTWETFYENYLDPDADRDQACYAMAGMGMCLSVEREDNTITPYFSTSKISSVTQSQIAIPATQVDAGRVQIHFEGVGFIGRFPGLFLDQGAAICLTTDTTKQECLSSQGYESFNLLQPPPQYNPLYAPPRQNMGHTQFFDCTRGRDIPNSGDAQVLNPAYINTESAITYEATPSSTGDSGWDLTKGNIGSDNRLQGTDNLPYVLTRQDYMGTRAKANGEKLGTYGKFCPKLQPLTSFVLLDSKELLSDVQSLAERINEQLHQSLPVFGNNQQNINQYNTNAFGYADTYKKSSEIVPCVNWKGFFPALNTQNTEAVYSRSGVNPIGGVNYTTYYKDWVPAYNQQWDTIAPMYSGGLYKIIPANFQPGFNQILANVGKVKPVSQASAEETYLRTCYQKPSEDEDGDSCSYNNCILGNMGLLDFPKAMMGDRFQRLPVWNGNVRPNFVKQNAREFNRPVILNDQFQYLLANPQQLCEPRTGQDTNPLYPPTTFESTMLIKNQLIFTNIPYGRAEVYSAAYNWDQDADAIKEYCIAQNINPVPSIDFSPFDDLKEQWRDYEQYINTQGTNNQSFQAQQSDVQGFSVEMDLGATDDEQTCCWNGVKEKEGVQSPLGQGIVPQRQNWDNTFPPTAAAQPYPSSSAAQTVCPITTTSIFATQQTDETQAFAVPVEGATRYPASNNWSWSENSNTLRPLGRLWIQSRYDPDWLQNSNTGGDPPSANGQYTTMPRSVALNETQCSIADLNGDLWADDTWSRENNMGIYPFQYTDDQNNKYIFCAFRVGQDYRATFDVRQNEKFVSTLRIGKLSWGTPLGIDIDSRYSNPGITPMNFEDAKRETLTGSSGGTFLAEKFYPQNTTPYLAVGAPNATFQYNSTKNRMELFNTHHNVFLSDFNTVKNISGGNNPVQIGEQCGIIGEKCPDAIFSPPQYFGQIKGEIPQTDVGLINGGGYEPNKNIRAEQSGIGIHKVWLVPTNYQAPSGISLSSYWSNTPERVQGDGQQKWLNAAGTDRNPLWRYRDNQDQTENNRQTILDGCTLATRKNWEGTFLQKCGFRYEQLMPIAGKPYNRYSQESFNNPDPLLQNFGTKPLILNNRTNITLNPDLNIAFNPNAAEVTGVPTYSLGFTNNQPAIVAMTPDVLTAKDPPTLSNSPFFQIYSDICPSYYQTGSTNKGIIFYLMRNYTSGGYAYGYSSSYSVTADRDYQLSSIKTEIRNPVSGKLAKCLSSSSVVSYRISRDKTLTPDYYDEMGRPVNKKIPPIAPPVDVEASINSMIEGTPDGKVAIPIKNNQPGGGPAELLFQALNITDANLQRQFTEGKTPDEIQEYVDDIQAEERLNDWDDINDGLETKRADNNSYDTPDTGGGHPAFRDTPATPDTAAKPKKSAGRSRRIRFEDGDGGETKEERKEDMKDKK